MNLPTEWELAGTIAQRVQTKGGCAYYVGGLVRDRMLGKEGKDIDIEVHGIRPDCLKNLLSEFGEVISIGQSFGIYQIRHYDIDIALPRKEKAIGCGHRDFEITVDPMIGEEKAAKRRDFTVNAMMENILTGEVLDFFGGKKDLQLGVLRHVDEKSFSEDPLRVLRGAQFAARFHFEIARETRELCRKMNLTYLARERVFEELKKALLQADRPSVFFNELRCMNQLSQLFSEIEQLQNIEQNPEYHPEGNVWNHTMEVIDRAASLRKNSLYPIGFMLSALCHDFGKITATKFENGKLRSIGHEVQGLPLADEFLQRLSSEEKLKRYVHNMVWLHMRPNMMAAAKSHKNKLMKMFDLSVCPQDLLLLAAADRGCCGNHSEVEQFLRSSLAEYCELQKSPPLTGTDLINAGYKPSADFSKMISFGRDLWLDGRSKEEALKIVLANYPLPL